MSGLMFYWAAIGIVSVLVVSAIILRRFLVRTWQADIVRRPTVAAYGGIEHRIRPERRVFARRKAGFRLSASGT
jgi:hypothetical protein